MDCSPPGYPVCGILQARILEWVAIPFFRGSSWRRFQPRDWNLVSCIAGRYFTVWSLVFLFCSFSIVIKRSSHIHWQSTTFNLNLPEQTQSQLDLLKHLHTTNKRAYLWPVSRIMTVSPLDLTGKVKGFPGRNSVIQGGESKTYSISSRLWHLRHKASDIFW